MVLPRPLPAPLLAFPGLPLEVRRHRGRVAEAQAHREHELGNDRQVLEGLEPVPGPATQMKAGEKVFNTLVLECFT